jgi:hypothetical protein
MFSTTVACIGLRTVLFFVSFSLLVGCGPSKVTYAVNKDFESQRKEKESQTEKYLKSATPAQRAELERNMEKMRNQQQ